MDGAATTETVFVPVAAKPSEFVTLQDNVRFPTDPALYVIAFVPEPPVMLPRVTAQAYVDPGWLGTEAMYPLIPVVAALGAVSAVMGAGTNVYEEELVAVPAAVVMLIAPVPAPEGVTAVIEVALTILKRLAATPLNLTAVAPVKLAPVKVTVVPTVPEAGVKPVMVGVAATVKAAALLVAVPAELLTFTANLAPLSAAVVVAFV
ncbi:MAG: hypothetical protein HY014_17565 [Acidobacteria bacterium]|nr:hypothetical protein [Acidobacteriota bacterium]MBI3489944.1 hypothetical protein [Acidobacteriota bacterium]